MPEPGAKEVEQLGGCLRERNQTLYRIGGVTEHGVRRTGEGSRWPYYQVEERGTGWGGGGMAGRRGGGVGERGGWKVDEQPGTAGGGLREKREPEKKRENERTPQ
jgi:hypothetical protein